MKPQPAGLFAILDSAEIGGMVEDLIERLHRGETVDSDLLDALYPEAAASLEQLLPAIHGLVDLSQSGPAKLADGVTGAGTMVKRRLGDFQIARELGRGGMGVVYEAEQLSLGRRVALKILPLAAVLNPRTLQRFKNEAQAAAALDHPHIVDVYGVGAERGVHYYAMRLIEGSTLAEVISQLRVQADRDPSKLPSSLAEVSSTHPSAIGQSRTRKSLAGNSSGDAGGRSSIEHRTVDKADDSTQAPARRLPFFTRTMFCSIAELGMSVAEGLAHAHEQGVIHRDIKPSNLMLDNQGKVWITDFGLAHIETNQSLTITGDLVGTVRYMSPEQAMAKRVVDHRTDIYSLGASLYELATMQPVFGDSDRAALIHKVAFSEPIAPRKINARIPADFETILLKMLEKNPVSRYASARDLADDLRRFALNLPISARRPSWGQHVAKWSVRHRGLVVTALGMALVAVALAGGILGWWAKSEAAANLAVERVAAELLESADSYQKTGAWPEALATLERAEAAFSGHGARSAMREQVTSRLQDARMVLRLDQIRFLAAAVAGGDFDFASTDAAYRAAFSEFGILLDRLAVADAAQLIRQNEIRDELAEALTNWSIVRKRLHRDEGLGENKGIGASALAEIAQRADPDSLRNRLRQAFESPGLSQAELIEIAGAAADQELPATTLVLLIEACSTRSVADSHVQEQLREIQRQHAGDFWINFALARYFERIDPPQLAETVRYYTAALGLRPNAAAVHSNLGATLQKQRDLQGAIAEYRLAIKLAPDFPLAYANLGFALSEQGKHDEAVVELKKSLALRDDLAVVHRNLGIAFLGQGRAGPAIESLRQAIELAPLAAGYHYDLGVALQSIGNVDEAVAAHRREIELAPKNPRPHNNVGALLELRGERDVALQEYRRAIALEPGYVRAHRNLVTCLQKMGRLADALVQAQRSLTLFMRDPKAGPEMQELVSDARRLAEVDINLPALLPGEQQPASARQAMDIARVCSYKRRYADAARFYSAALHQDPAQADDHRYDAACASVVAASEHEQDSVTLPKERRAELRSQALAWLRAELHSRQEQSVSAKASDRMTILRSLSHWQSDHELASVRDEPELAELPSEERDAWRQLWTAVAQLREKTAQQADEPAERMTARTD